MAIAAQDEHQQRAELRIAFLKHLPRRLDQLVRRGRRLRRHGWDINALSLLHDDVQRVGGAAGRYGALEVSERLLAIEHVLERLVRDEEVPDGGTDARLGQLFDALAGEPAPPPPIAPVAAIADDDTAHAAQVLDNGRAETPPSHYWRRWAAEAPTAVADAAPAYDAPQPRADDAPATAAEPEGADAPPPPSVSPTAPTAPAVAAPSAAAPATRAPSKPGPRKPARIYHLAGTSDLTVELDQRLEALGDEVEILQDSDELKEVLAALAPDLVIVDAEFADELESIGAVLRSTRERTGARLRLLALAEQDAMSVRLAARRAGADALLIAAASAIDVIDKVDGLLDSEAEEAYRVMIVEDDRSQGLFAESILRNAGMQAQVVDNAFDVLEAMADFHPDLVLMDLYMPGCDGTELTALIREREEFLHTPIVFLSGESDLDKHYAALDAGGDDFLSKPIRPKHLISAVSNRVRRARALLKRVATRDPKDAVTGLFARSYALDRINELLAEDNARSRPGGVLFLDLDGIPALREKLGLSAVEQLLAEAGTLIVGKLGAQEIACRYGDGCFLAVCPERPDGALDALAAELRTMLITHPFVIGGRPLRLRLAVGICPFRLGFADAASLLNTAERTSRSARASDAGVQLFTPPRRAADEQEHALVGLLRNAIERDGFELLYQPIVAVQGGEQPQYQTLLRLRDDIGRLHAAAEIIPAAEHAELIVDVDRWVLNQALRTLESRHLLGMPVRLFVNQSPASLASPDHAEWLISQLRARRLPGDLLVIELALDEIDQHIEVAAAFCQRLQPEGVQFCLSRYEASERGQLVLGQLPVQFVKLAPKYLGAVQAQALRDELRVLIDNAHLRGLLMIAQRVEDAQSAATLWMSGIDFIQGNLVQQAGRDLAFDFHAAVL